MIFLSRQNRKSQQLMEHLEMALLEVIVLFFARWELKHTVSMMTILTRLVIRIIIEKSKQIFMVP